MYHVIGTGITTILFYITSYLFYRFGYYSIQFHKKIWNSFLAIAFILTAIAGIFMALQITYKWDIPFIKSVLKWHVEFGIGMAFTGFIHFLWHLSYFTRLFIPQESAYESNDIYNLTSLDLKVNLFILGFVSSAIQLLLIREMMNIAGGYELITGIFLGSWLIGSAIGAAIAGKSLLSDIKKINIIFSLSPVFSIFLMLFLSRLFVNTGETPSFLVSIIFTFLVLVPFCMVSGFTFVKLIYIARASQNYSAGKSFSMEITGGVASGIAIPILTSGFLNTYQLLLLIILLSVTYVLISFYLSSYKAKLFARIIATLLAFFLISFNPDIFFRQILLRGINVTDSKDTPYGNITTGQYNGEQSIYYNHRLLSYIDDVIEREENIHYAMLQSDLPQKVMLISGSLHSQLPEILKYPVSEIIFIERDPALAVAGLSYSDTLTGGLTVENKDAFRYIRNSGKKVDVIILSVPPPSTLLLNRYYTTEFFNEVKKNLEGNGIFMCSPGAGNNYFNKESLRLYSSIYNSLAGVFRNVMPVVGNKLYFIASDNELSVSFCKLSEKRKIINTYVSADFLSDDLIKRKSDQLISLIDHNIKQNREASPVASFHFQSYNLSKNLDEKAPALIILIIVFAVPLLAVKRRNLIMYFSASALAGFEIIILLTLQIIVGNMYQLTGLIIAGLMAGLAVGAGTEIKILSSVSLRKNAIILILFYVFVGLLYSKLLLVNSDLPAIVLIILSVFIPAILTGHIFRELTRVRLTEISSSSSTVYSADLAGSAFGFILISGLAVPAFGIKLSILLLSLLIFAGLIFGTIRNKNI